MYNKNTKTSLMCSIILDSMGVFCLVCLSFVVMALQLLYAHARTEEAAILYLQTCQLLTRDAPNCPTCNRAKIKIGPALVSISIQIPSNIRYR